MATTPAKYVVPTTPSTPPDAAKSRPAATGMMTTFTPEEPQNDPSRIHYVVRTPTENEKRAWRAKDDLAHATSKMLMDGSFFTPPSAQELREMAMIRPVTPSELQARCLAMRDEAMAFVARGTFGRQTNKVGVFRVSIPPPDKLYPNGNGNMNQQKGPGSGAPSPTIPYGPAMPPALPALNTSGSFAPSAEAASPQVENQNPNQNQAEPMEKEKPKHFFNPKYAKLGVKGNFMPLAAQPKNVDIAEWLGHHCMENYRLVAALLQVIQEVDGNTGLPICNPKGCPVMSAGRSHTYTWLNNEKVPIKVPACQYISLVQRWIVGKMDDSTAFPTNNITSGSSAYVSGGLNTIRANTPIAAGPTTSNAPLSQLAGRNWLGKSAGFPESFYGDVKTCFRQMFRLYAHMYHSHWVDPFWHLSSGSNTGGYTDLNSCFVHFISVAKLFGLISEKDMEPMQPLIDIWIQNGSIPVDAIKGACAISPNQ